MITRDDGSIERFLEKPTWGQVFSDTINTGIFVLEPEIFDYIEPDRAGRLLRPRCSRRCSSDGKPLFGAVAEGYWEDVGTLEAYLRAHKDILDGRCRSTSPASSWATACGWGRAPRSTPTPRSSARPSSARTAASRPASGSGPYTVLGANVRVRADADLERVVVHDNAYLGEGVRLRGAIIGRSCDLRARRPRRGGRGARRRVLRRRARRRWPRA